MGRSPESFSPVSPESAKRLDIAINLVADRRLQIQQQHGTLYSAGSDPSKWLPFHSYEIGVLPIQLCSIFSKSLAVKDNPPEELAPMFPDLQSRDLPGLLITTGFFYADFTDLYKCDTSLIEKKMDRYPDVFTQRDKDIAHAAISAVITVPEEEASRNVPRIDPESPYAIQSAIFADTYLSHPSQSAAMPLGMLVCLERLIKADTPFMTDVGERPRTLTEVLDIGTTYDKHVLRERLNEMDDYFYAHERTEDLQLPMSKKIFPYYAANKNYFTKHVKPLINADDKDIDFATMFRGAITFAQRLEGGLS